MTWLTTVSARLTAVYKGAAILQAAPSPPLRRAVYYCAGGRLQKGSEDPGFFAGGPLAALTEGGLLLCGGPPAKGGEDPVFLQAAPLPPLRME